jgi:hypothetical protein
MQAGSPCLEEPGRATFTAPGSNFTAFLLRGCPWYSAFRRESSGSRVAANHEQPEPCGHGTILHNRDAQPAGLAIPLWDEYDHDGPWHVCFPFLQVFGKFLSLFIFRDDQPVNTGRVAATPPVNTGRVAATPGVGRDRAIFVLGDGGFKHLVPRRRSPGRVAIGMMGCISCRQKLCLRRQIMMKFVIEMALMTTW